MKKINRLFWTFIGLMIFCVAVVVGEGIQYITSDDSRQSCTADGMYELRLKKVPVNGRVILGDTCIANPDRNLTVETVPTQSELRFLSPQPINCGKVTLSRFFEWARYIALLLAYLLGIVCTISFYKSFRKSEKLKLHSIRQMHWVGIVVIIASLLHTAHYLTLSFAVIELMPDNGVPPHIMLDVNFTEIIFGIVIFFLAHMLRINYNLQEEQELTV